MSFKIIEGKNKIPIDIQKQNLAKKNEQLKYFVSHMRTIESSISSVKSMTLKLEWQELNNMLNDCHKKILDTLSFVKQETNKNSQNINNLNKPLKRNKHLKIVKTDDDI